MDSQTLETQIKYLAVVFAALVFLAAVYSLPIEAFFGVFAAGLFLIPAMYFVHIVHKMAAA